MGLEGHLHRKMVTDGQGLEREGANPEALLSSQSSLRLHPRKLPHTPPGRGPLGVHKPLHLGVGEQPSEAWAIHPSCVGWVGAWPRDPTLGGKELPVLPSQICSIQPELNL